MFTEIFEKYDWNTVQNDIYAKTETDVEKALGKYRPDLEDFKALISPAATKYLEEMAQLSHKLTVQRFGKTMQLYIPMYVSNECQNICSYCGFSLNNKIPRITLNDKEILNEVDVIKSYGYQHLLIVSGEANKTVGPEYFRHVLDLLKGKFSQLSLEVQPLETIEYQSLVDRGLHSVLVYQETYNKENYKVHHLKGKKSNFNYRLETPDRLGQAGIRKIGLGVLIGLEDWRTDSFFTAAHLTYLEKKYWQSNFSISFPRLRPFEGCETPKSIMNDRELIQLISAYRIFNQELELSLSTRESAYFRDHAFKLGITTMSAGSKTKPGGYAKAETELEQFEISDERSAGEISKMLSKNGYEPVWKDWDIAYHNLG